MRLATPGLNPSADPGRIVLLHSVSQFGSRLGRPATKWDSEAFSATGEVVSGTLSQANWGPIYINILRHPVNVTSSASIDTTLAATTPTLLMDPVEDSDVGSTPICVRRTVHVLPLLVLILLVNEISPVKAWLRLRGEIITDNLEADCR